MSRITVEELKRRRQEFQEEAGRADEAGDPGEEVACPICGGPVRCEKPADVAMENREVQTRRGKVEYERAARQCQRCRRVFFPRG